MNPVMQQAQGNLLIKDRKSTRLNSSHGYISYAVFCLKKKKNHALYRGIKHRRDVGRCCPPPPPAHPTSQKSAGNLQDTKNGSYANVRSCCAERFAVYISGRVLYMH